jgi:hypothetical protein
VGQASGRGDSQLSRPAAGGDQSKLANGLS